MVFRFTGAFSRFREKKKKPDGTIPLPARPSSPTGWQSSTRASSPTGGSSSILVPSSTEESSSALAPSPTGGQPSSRALPLLQAQPPPQGSPAPSAQIIGHGNTFVSNYVQNINQSEIAEILKPKLIHGADLDSLSRHPPPRCQVGTRVDILRETIDWRDDAEHLYDLLWITGPAGSGKSAIAQTFGEDCQKAGRLGAALFLSREHHGDQFSLLIPTIAYQLATHNPNYRHLLSEALANDPVILEKGLPTQFRKLILDPAQALHMNPGSFVIILDGLSECGGRASQLELIELIDGRIHSPDRSSPFLWLICTRPEPHLMKVLAKLGCGDDVYCKSGKLLIDDDQSVEDVTQLFRKSFSDVREQYLDMFDDEEWPAEEQLQRLVKASSGYFLVASDIVRFVGDSDHQDPIAQLAVCLDFLDSPYPSVQPNPFHSLDITYRQILSNVRESVLPTTLNILRLCDPTLESSYTVQTIQAVLGIDRFAFYRAFQDLHSLLHVPSSEKAHVEGPRFYHSSFPDFLDDPGRSGKYTTRTMRQGSQDIPKSGGMVGTVAPSVVGTVGMDFADNTRKSSSPSSATAGDDMGLSGVDHLSKLSGIRADDGTNPKPTPANDSEAGVRFALSGSIRLDDIPYQDSGSKVAMLLSRVLKNSRSRKVLYNLSGDQGQLMIDYLHSLLLEPSLPTPWLRKYSLIALHELSKTSLLYPHCYVLKDIIFGPREDGGTFSDVHKGRYGGQYLCLKVVRLHKKIHTDAMLKIYSKEAILWGQLNHPNIIPFYGVYYRDEARNQVCLVSPWMDHGNLVEYLEKNPSAPRFPFIHDIAAGLDYLHNLSLIHSDLKGMNILVDGSERACITDFGLSFVRTDQTLAYTFASSTSHGFSLHWAAPELLEDKVRPTLASDVWALGCVFYEVLTGLLPYGTSTDAQIIRKILVGELPTIPGPASSPGSVEDDIWKLVKRCWAREPGERPACGDILRELKQRGITREQEANLEGATQVKRAFQDAMRKNEEVPVDLDQVEQILNGLLM